jgi:peroxiredoxin
MERATAEALRVAVGEPIPSVGLRATDGYLLNLRSFVTKQPACFFFFGAPTLTGTDAERGEALASAFARGYQRLTDAGIALVGVTCDSERQQTDYATSRRLPFLLFSDERRTAVELLGVPTISRGDNHNAMRIVIGVDEGGVIRLIATDPDPERVVDEVLTALSGKQPPAA